MIREAVQEAAAGQDAASWQRLLVALTESPLPPAQLHVEVAWLRRELASWPIEVSRPPPEVCDRPAVLQAIQPLVRVVRENDLYPAYVERICTSPLLRLQDGSQAVRLARAFTGSVGDIRIGQAGQGDLVGGLCVEYRRTTWAVGHPIDRAQPPGDLPPTNLPLARPATTTTHRLEVRLEVEVKMDRGRVREAQDNRRRSFEERGAIYLVVNRIADAVARLCEVRDKIVATLEA